MSEDDPAGTAVAAEVPSDAEVARLRAELEAAAKRVDDLVAQLRRAHADYDNLQKRTAREVEEIRATANEALLASLLPVLDDFDHAIAGTTGEAREGLRLLHANLWRALEAAGLEAIRPAGQPFDPFEHEVVGDASDEGLSDGTVKAVVQPGYRYRRRLLRPAKVIVVKRGE